MDHRELSIAADAAAVLIDSILVLEPGVSRQSMVGCE